MPPAPFPQKGGMRFAGGSREQDSEPDDKHQQADRADAGGGVPKILPAPGEGEGRCYFPYKLRIMGTNKPLRTLNAPYIARNPMISSFFGLKKAEKLLYVKIESNGNLKNKLIT